MLFLKFIYNQQNTEQMDYKMLSAVNYCLHVLLFGMKVLNKWGFLQDLEMAKLLNFFYQGHAACG